MGFSALPTALNFFPDGYLRCARLKGAGNGAPMIIALAGRRVDAADEKQRRFPSENVDIVRERIHAMLLTQCAVALVGSAACGADLLALSEAGKLGLRRSVVLPFGRENFRTTSVTDRPGDWGALYDQQLNDVEKSGDLLVVHEKSDDKAYAEANHAIVDKALSLGQELRDRVAAVLVWDGKSRGERDLTEEFGFYARGKSIPVIEVMTL
jgi:hypothetical protein